MYFTSHYFNLSSLIIHIYSHTISTFRVLTKNNLTDLLIFVVKKMAWTGQFDDFNNLVSDLPGHKQVQPRQGARQPRYQQSSTSSSSGKSCIATLTPGINSSVSILLYLRYK